MRSTNLQKQPTDFNKLKFINLNTPIYDVKKAKKHFFRSKDYLDTQRTSNPSVESQYLSNGAESPNVLKRSVDGITLTPLEWLYRSNPRISSMTQRLMSKSWAFRYKYMISPNPRSNQTSNISLINSLAPRP